MRKNGAHKGAAAIALASLVAGTIASNAAQAAAAPVTQFLGTGSSVRAQLLGSGERSASPANNLYAENKAGEGKCGEGKCGETKKDTHEKTAEGKCGEGKCGEKKKEESSADATHPTDDKSGEGKCGEGKCGGSK